GGARTQRRIHNAALHINSEEPPRIRPRSILPATGRPGLRSRFSGPGHGVKGPKQLTGLRIPPANVTVGSRAGRTLTITASCNYDVTKDGGRRIQRIPPFLQIP